MSHPQLLQRPFADAEPHEYQDGSAPGERGSRARQGERGEHGSGAYRMDAGGSFGSVEYEQREGERGGLHAHHSYSGGVEFEAAAPARAEPPGLAGNPARLMAASYSGVPPTAERCSAEPD